jgi:gluconate 2-dehydrogenase gamma chain
MHDEQSRRVFLSRFLAGTGASLALSAFPELVAAHQHASKQVGSSDKTLHFLTAAEAKELEAVCEQIIPSETDAPGAREAGAIYFIDYALAKAEPDLQPVFRVGLKDLAAAVEKTNPSKKFSELTSEQQIAILKSIEQSDFFQLARKYTIIGFLGDPQHGGNRDEVGWKYIGFENAGMFQPPFGYYDAELLNEKKEGK